MKLNPKNFGFAFGILWGGSVFVMTLLSLWFGYANAFLNVLATIYPGYSVSLLGIFLGLIYGFVDGFVGAYILIWLYNQFEKK